MRRAGVPPGYDEAPPNRRQDESTIATPDSVRPQSPLEGTVDKSRKARTALDGVLTRYTFLVMARESRLVKIQAA